MAAAPQLVTHRRYDRGGELLRAHRRASDGALLAECIPTREGILEYVRADGTIRRELVTKQALLDTARTAPRSAMTLLHPKEGFIKADSYARLGVGDVDGGAEVLEDAQGGFVKLKIAVRRDDALRAIDSGECAELSLGYDVTLDETPGEHPAFGRYDAAQVGRDCNHLALVPKGRAVTDLRTDSGDAYQRAPVATAPREDRHMDHALIAALALLGITRVDSAEAALRECMAKLKARKDADEAAAGGPTVESLQAEVTTLKAKVATLEAAATTKDGEMAAVVAENTAMKADAKAKADAAELTRLQGLATKVGVKHDGLALPALRVAIAKSRVDSVDDKTPAAFLDGVLAMVESDASKRGDGRYDFAPPKAREDGKREDAADGQRRDSHYNPYLRSADDARTGGTTTGASR